MTVIISNQLNQLILECSDAKFYLEKVVSCRDYVLRSKLHRK